MMISIIRLWSVRAVPVGGPGRRATAGAVRLGRLGADGGLGCPIGPGLCAADGLPEGLIHPDFVLVNVVATPGGMVLVDWAGAGRGPRLWSLAFALYAEAAKEPRRAGAVLLGYREHVTLETEELDRLGAVAQARPARTGLGSGEDPRADFSQQ
jgi:hypothetical protein